MQISVICLLGIVTCASAQLDFIFNFGKSLSLSPFEISKNASFNIGLGRQRRQLSPVRIGRIQPEAKFEFNFGILPNEAISQPGRSGSGRPEPSETKPDGSESGGSKAVEPKSAERKPFRPFRIFPLFSLFPHSSRDEPHHRLHHGPHHRFHHKSSTSTAQPTHHKVLELVQHHLTVLKLNRQQF
ncbi:hypothetical protein HZH68_003818 [Vespula germanica]|uniref:Uncharacterized protein n=1 Tax=Vespula germanica TaxID=30212 RepID=A0A834KP10_VESGE|nr:hypothetical protein HZH68_003818 [Vespula germanica]